MTAASLCLRSVCEEDLRPRTHFCGHIVAHDASWAAQTWKHLLWAQNVSEQHQKHFLSPGHKICVRNKCCARGQTGKHLCWQQFDRNNVSSFARAFRLFALDFYRAIVYSLACDTAHMKYGV